MSKRDIRLLLEDILESPAGASVLARAPGHIVLHILKQMLSVNQENS